MAPWPMGWPHGATTTAVTARRMDDAGPIDPLTADERRRVEAHYIHWLARVTGANYRSGRPKLYRRLKHSNGTTKRKRLHLPSWRD